MKEEATEEELEEARRAARAAERAAGTSCKQEKAKQVEMLRELMEENL